MISLLPPIPNAPASLETLSNMLILLSDPVAAKARVAEMTAATAALQQAIAESKAQAAAGIVAEADHKAALAQREADAADRLAEAQKAFDAACTRRTDEISAREANVKELQATAADDAKAAKAARTDYERRLAIIKSATG
jgi:hypothetical protein